MAILVALVSTACATNPATGERMLSLISEDQEIAMGQQYSEQIAATMSVYDDPDLQEGDLLHRVGQPDLGDHSRPSGRA